MSDAELRERERRARDGGSDDVLVHARALERAGRDGPAFEALLAGVAHPEVRRELAGRPAWTHPDANAGGTRWLDVAPIRAHPRLAWLRSGAEAPPSLVPGLLASPLGIVIDEDGPAGDGDLVERRARVLDPRSGDSRFVVPHENSVPSSLRIRGDGLLARGPTGREPAGRETAEVVLHDLHPGAPRFALADGSFTHELLATGDLLVMDLAEASLLLHRWPEAGRPPTLAWRRPMSGSIWRAFQAGGRLACVDLERTRVRWLALEDGSVLDEHAGDWPCLDEEGAVVPSDAENPPLLRAVDRAGTTLFEARLHLLALAPTHVLAYAPGAALPIVALDRRSGALRWRLDVGPRRLAEPSLERVAVVRDVVLHARGRRLSGFSLGDGSPLWSLDLEPGSPAIVALAALPGRIYGRLANDATFCVMGET